MPYKNPAKRLEYALNYHKKYYEEHRDERLKYRKSRRIKDREIWRRYWLRKKDAERRKKISLGQVYTKKKIYPY